jgi:SnoaL-like domain
MTRTTDEVIDRFNRAFQERDATLLVDIIAPDCVMESVQPAPTAPATRAMTRRSARGRRSSTTSPATSRWRTSTPATSGRSSVGATSGGPGLDDSVRGVNVMRVVDGKIVEAAGYSKTAPVVAALES